MHFTATFIPLLFAAATLGSPSPKAYSNSIARDTLTSTNTMADAIRFAAQADCDIFQCANVVASAGCIIGGFALGPAGVPVVLACVAGGSTGICPCAGCIDALNDFLTENNVCGD